MGANDSTHAILSDSSHTAASAAHGAKSSALGAGMGGTEIAF